MIDFGDDTAGECFIVVHGGHPFPRYSATFDRLNNIRLMPVNPQRTGRRFGVLPGLPPHKSSMCSPEPAHWFMRWQTEDAKA